MRKMTRRPTHPGIILKEDYLLPLSVTIKDMAETHSEEWKKVKPIPQLY